jgi:hypothetical protein
MRRTSLSFCVCLLLLLLTFSGCGKAESEDTLITITSDGETTLPYLYWSWSHSWTDDTWVEADALQLVYALPEIARELPTVCYCDDFTVQYQEGVSFAYMSIYDQDFERLYHIYPSMDLSCLEELPEGKYYISISVVAQGEYIKPENEYEYNGSDCVFMLVVER